MRNRIRFAAVGILAGALLFSASGCFSYGGYGYGNYRSQIKTTASPENATVFDLKNLQAEDGSFELKGLPWGSSVSDVEAYAGMPVGATSAFVEGETLADMNYSVKIGNHYTVGFEPLFSKEGTLMSLSLYYEQTYTSEQMDEILDEVVALAVEAFGKEDKTDTSVVESGKQKFTTTGYFWYQPVEDGLMTSLQIGKVNDGSSTTAVVIGINRYDPALIESSSEEGSDEGQTGGADSPAAADSTEAEAVSAGE